jgi:hypothetical protein
MYSTKLLWGFSPLVTWLLLGGIISDFWPKAVQLIVQGIKGDSKSQEVYFSVRAACLISE